MREDSSMIEIVVEGRGEETFRDASPVTVFYLGVLMKCLIFVFGLTFLFYITLNQR